MRPGMSRSFITTCSVETGCDSSMKAKMVLAGEGKKILMVTVFTLHRGKTVVQVAAIKITGKKRRGHKGSAAFFTNPPTGV